MGKIVLLSDEMPDLLPMRNRSLGVHVSDVIRRLCVQSGMFNPGGRDDVNLTNQWAQLGCSLEDALVNRYDKHFPGRYVRPGEVCLDGIYGTPDLQDTFDGGVDEVKLAWMGSGTDPSGDKMWRYRAQVKAYCKMLKTLIGRLHITHVNGRGDYKGGPGPHFRLWEQRFSQSELDANWEMIKLHAELIRKGE